MSELKTRSLVKAISWRIIASLITAFLVYFFTGKLVLAFSVGAMDSIVKILAYYAHERMWMSIPLGKLKHPLEDIKLSKEIDEEDKEIIRNKLKELGYIDD